MTQTAPQDKPWTVGRLLEWTTDYFEKNAIDNPRLDVEVLLAHVLQCERIGLYANYDAPVDDAHRSQFRSLVKERAAGCPVAYLVGYREFYTLRFEVNRSVLIPRPETEHVVIEALDFAKQADRVKRYVEVGVGSGAICVTVAHECARLTGVGIDVSSEAIDVARRNAQANGVQDRIEFRVGDVYSTLGDERFDMILSNPPYVRTGEWELLEPTARDYEPRLALDGGPEGLDVLRRVVSGAAAHLNPGGKLILEIGASQEANVRQLVEAETELSVGPTIRDLAGLPRVVTACRKGL